MREIANREVANRIASFDWRFGDLATGVLWASVILVALVREVGSRGAWFALSSL